MSDLPPGWEWTTIGELLAPLEDGRTIHQGWSPRCEKHPAPEGSWGVLKTTAIQPGAFQPEHNKALPAALDPRPGIEVRRGDHLLTCAGPRSRCGVACLVRATRPRLMTSGKMYRFRVNESHISARYLDAYLQTARAWLDIDAMKTGGSDSGLNLTQGRFRGLAVPVAPRAEQERIVEVLEEHFSRLDAVAASLRSALLRLAQMTAKIKESILTQGPQLPLAKLAVDSRYGTSVKCSYVGAGPGVIRIPNIIEEQVDIGDLKYSTDESAVSSDLLLREGDLLFVRTNGSRDLIGRAAIASGEAEGLGFASYLIRYRLHDHVDPRYVCAAMSSPSIRRVLEGLAATTAGQYNLSISKLDSVTIPVPPLDVQQHLLQARAHGLDGVARMRREISAAQRRTASLRRSLLASAFSGRLVPQDSADEPASALLDRIRAERAAAAPAKRMRKARTS